MVTKWALLFLTYKICIDYLHGITIPCGQKYQAENGNLCYPCGSGYIKVSDCVVNEEQARCRLCENGKYQPSCDNSSFCADCKPVCSHPKQVKVKNCTVTSDIECQCIAGFYWSPDTAVTDEGYCAKHNKCRAGEGLVEKGTPYENTKCEPCEEGVTYSSIASFDACVPCSVCNSTVAFKCTTTSDVVCSTLPDKPSPTDSSSKDGGQGKVLLIVFSVLTSLAVVFGALGLGYYIYRRRQNRENVTSLDSELYRVDIPNGSTHNSTQGQTGEVHCCPMSNGFHQSARSQDADDDSNSNGTISTTFSQNQCISSETPDDNVRSDCSNKSTEVLQVRQTQNDITDEDQKTIDDILQKSKQYTINATPENDARNNCSNNRAEVLQGRPNTRETKDMKKKSQDSETRRSELGDGSATLGIVKGETVVDLSIDAAGVSPKHEVQWVSFSTRTSGEMSNPDDADLTTRTIVCSEIDESDIGTQSDGNYVSTPAQASSVRPPTSSSTEEVWLEVNTFMSSNLSWDKFKMVYRRLTSETNTELYETVEADMDNAFIEAHNKAQEAMYKLMIHWRQAARDATIKHIYQALEDCRHKRLSEKLQSEVEKSRAPVNRALGQICDNGQNVVEAPPRGELSASAILQSVNIDTNGIAANGHRANNLRMGELK